MSDLPDLSELRIRGEQDCFQFLQTDLDLCLTFVEVAITQLGLNKRDAAKEVLAKAEQEYATIERLMARLEEVGNRVHIEEKLIALRWALDTTGELIRRVSNTEERTQKANGQESAGLGAS